MSTAAKIPAHDVEAERALVAAALADACILDDVGDTLTPEHFYASRLGVAWRAMQRLHGRGEPVDLVTLRSELVATGLIDRAGGEDALLSLTERTPLVDSAEAYARRVAQLASVRAMARACMDIADRAYRPIEDVDAFLDGAESAIHATASTSRSEDRSASMRELATEVFLDIQRRAESGPVRGLPTGVTALDEMLSGLKAQELVIVAGRPGMGKSALAGASALASAATGPVLVWSGEMSRSQWAERMIVAESGIHGSIVRAGRSAEGAMSRRQWTAIGEAASRVAQLPITVDDTPSISLWQLRSKARRLRAREGLALVVVDYLQLMRSGERMQSREQEVAAISRGLKGLAKELEVPVMALSQLNRASEKTSDKRPGLADLRESGQIEQDADAVLFCFRPGYYDRELPQESAEVIVAKQRGGATGTVPARFEPHLTRWSDAAVAEPAHDWPSDFDDDDWSDR